MNVQSAFSKRMVINLSYKKLFVMVNEAMESE